MVGIKIIVVRAESFKVDFKVPLNSKEFINKFKVKINPIEQYQVGYFEK